MRKSKMWRMMTVAAVAASMTCGLFGVQSVSADDKKTLKVAMECGYAPYNWTQPDDSNGAVQISGSSDYAYGYDVMMATSFLHRKVHRLCWWLWNPANVMPL